MEVQTGDLARARRQLEAQGRFPGGALPADIAESWTRSIAHGLDPTGAGRTLMVEGRALAEARERHEDLIRFARPELELLFDQIAGSNFMVALGSPEGVVLETLADPHFVDGAGRDVVPGSVWTEALRGTNAMGLALATGLAAQVYGGEHYLRGHAGIACISAPIFDGRGGLAGVLDASSGSTVRQQHTAALVQMSASNIENGLIRRVHEDRLVLQFHPRPEYLGTLSVGMLVLEGDLRIHAINRRGTLLLTGLPALIGRGFEDVFEGRVDEALRRLVQGETLRVRDRFGSAVSMRCVANRASFALAGGKRRGEGAARTPAGDRNLFKDVVVEDPGLWRQLVALPDAARAGLPIAIEGEIGTGKEIVARLAHAASGRSGPFVAFDARLADPSSAERVIFGEKDDPGLIGRAAGGTLCLDEVAALPVRAQTALTRLLDLGEYRRCGTSESSRADLFIVSSALRPLDEAVTEGRLLPELRFRLAGFTLALPPLRKRSDRAVLARRLLAAADPSLLLDERAVALIEAHPWPGNLHELRACMARAALMASGPVVSAADLADLQGAGSEETACDGCRDVPWKAQQCRQVRAEVALHNGNVSRAARRLGMSRTTVYRHLDQI